MPATSHQQRLSLVLRLHSRTRTMDELVVDLPFPREELIRELRSLVDDGLVRRIVDEPPRYELAPDADRIIAAMAPPPPEVIDDEPADRVAWLRRISLFATLADESIASLAEGARTVRFEPRSKLFIEGDPCEGIYVVESGVIKLLKQVGDETTGMREQTIRLVAANDFFNEVPVFDGGANPVSAEAMEESVVLVIPTDQVRQLMASDPAFVQQVIADLAGRVRHLIAMVQDLSLRQVSGRVAKILLQSVEPTEGVGVGAERHPKLTQRDIAEMAGTVREVVARTLREFERKGAIETESGRVVAVDRSKLIDLL